MDGKRVDQDLAGLSKCFTIAAMGCTHQSSHGTIPQTPLPNVVSNSIFRRPLCCARPFSLGLGAMDTEHQVAHILANAVVNRIFLRQCVCLVCSFTVSIFPPAWWWSGTFR